MPFRQGSKEAQINVTTDEKVAKTLPKRYGKKNKITTVLWEELCSIVARRNKESHGPLRC
jgi:hypothetical protein